MSSSLASASFFFRRPARQGLRYFDESLPAAPARRVSVSSGVAKIDAPFQPAANNSAWTAEEQQFLRALREAGL